MNFAVRLLRELILPQELYGRNVSGTRGKQAVDPCKVEQIRTIVQKFYPAPPLVRVKGSGENAARTRICENCLDQIRVTSKSEI